MGKIQRLIDKYETMLRDGYEIVFITMVLQDLRTVA